MVPPRKPTGPAITARAPREIAAGLPIEVSINIDDPANEVTELILRWRRKDAVDFSSTRIPRQTGEAKLTGLIPGAMTGDEPGELLYYVQAVDSEGRQVMTAGTEEEPQTLTLLQGEDPDAWVWWTVGLVTGAAIIGAAIATAVSLSSGGDEIPSGAAGVTVNIR